MGQTANSLFAEQGLGVQFVEPGAGRGPENVLDVAHGDRDFCLTSVHHYLTALNKADGPLAARFVAVLVRHSPVAAIVPDDSPMTRADDMAGVRISASADKPHGAEFLAALRHRGHNPPELVSHDPERQHAALAHGEVAGAVEFIDAMPRLRRLVGCRVRAVPVGLPVYASGLVAADRVPDGLVTRVRTALVAALRAQRHEPQANVDDLVSRYPDIRADEATEGWQLIEPYIFTGAGPGAMHEHEWQQTLEHLCTARGLNIPRLYEVYRPHREISRTQTPLVDGESPGVQEQSC